MKKMIVFKSINSHDVWIDVDRISSVSKGKGAVSSALIVYDGGYVDVDMTPEDAVEEIGKATSLKLYVTEKDGE